MSASTASDERWMRRALALARRGVALTHPNPMVGAVVVREDRPLAEAFHTWDGRVHAEALAIRRAGAAARGATLYLNLEPCCHTGRTPPCTEAILSAGIGRVVAAMADPNPAVSGKGFRALRRAGVEVEVGIGQEEAQRLNEAFALWIRRRRPFVTLKAAATLDGQLAFAPPVRRAGRAAPGRRIANRWISSAESRARVQQMRHTSDAVLTGIGTVLADDPLLTDRSGGKRRRPLQRVVLDADLRLPVSSRLARTAAGDAIVFTLLSAERAAVRRLERAGVRVVRVPGRRGKLDLAQVLSELGKMEIVSLMAEAGPALNGALLSAGLVEKLVLFYAPVILGREVVPLARGGRAAGAPLAEARHVSWSWSGPDLVLEGYLRDVYRDH